MTSKRKDREHRADLTCVLEEIAQANGPEADRRSSEELLPLVYDELRKLARARLAREAPGQTLQATALVHEAYLRLLGGPREGDWNGRGHFFGAAALAMRRILVEQARRKARLRHGGGRRRVELGEAEIVLEPHLDVLAVDEALRRLEREDPRKGKIVGLRYFAGLTVEETAAALELSVGTIEREWRFIKAWLKTELAEKKQEFGAAGHAGAERAP